MGAVMLMGGDHDRSRQPAAQFLAFLAQARACSVRWLADQTTHEPGSCCSSPQGVAQTLRPHPLQLGRPRSPNAPWTREGGAPRSPTRPWLTHPPAQRPEYSTRVADNALLLLLEGCKAGAVPGWGGSRATALHCVRGLRALIENAQVGWALRWVRGLRALIENAQVGWALRCVRRLRALIENAQVGWALRCVRGLRALIESAQVGRALRCVRRLRALVENAQVGECAGGQCRWARRGGLGGGCGTGMDGPLLPTGQHTLAEPCFLRRTVLGDHDARGHGST